MGALRLRKETKEFLTKILAEKLVPMSSSNMNSLLLILQKKNFFEVKGILINLSILLRGVREKTLALKLQKRLKTLGQENNFL